MKDMLVSDWMTTDVITVNPNTMVPAALKLMETHEIRRLPVLDKGKLVGIVTRSDMRQAQPSSATSLSVWELNYLLNKLSISEIMTRNLITIAADAPLGDAANLLKDHKIGALPVVDARGMLVGLLTESDIFRVIVSWINEELALA